MHQHYAIGIIERRNVFLHRFIVGYYDHAQVVDHINRNKLDNRKANLRIVSQSVNAANNASTGVCETPTGKFRAYVCHNGKTMALGTFASEKEAIEYRRNKKRELFGV